ncbi:hypothetical protein IOD14_44005 (plasmid) [Streptomyces sp. A2-16]|uniref:hypothetical protein n=1 Tax=Streptomyces sp. A2-16 TaxID=2781734 RepID=UPI001BAEA80E|nr:hypothetical protein [Streptomyces sp. A2-16]QUC63812.1 hypothetical protein IOD14_44005 [Streptomyces sp. A2-16]
MSQNFFPAALAEQYRIESVACSLRNGESTVINGTLVTAVSLEEAERACRDEPVVQRPEPQIEDPAIEVSGYEVER